MNIINSVNRLSIPNIYLKQKKTRKTKKTKKTKKIRKTRKTRNNIKKTRNNKRKSRIIKSQEKIGSIFDKIEYLCNQLNYDVMNNQIRVILLFILECIFIKWIITENININHFFTKKSAKIKLENGHDSLMKTLHKYGVDLDDVIIKVDGNIVDIKEKNMSVFIDKSNIEYPSYTHVFEKLNIVYNISDSNTKLYEVPENYIIECVDIFSGITNFISCKEYIQNKTIKQIISILNENGEKIYYTKYFYVILQEETKPILFKKLFIDIPTYYIFHNKYDEPFVCSSNVYNKIKFFTDELNLTCIDETSLYKVGGMFEEDTPSQESFPFTQKEVVLKQPKVLEAEEEVVLKEPKVLEAEEEVVLKEPTVLEKEEKEIVDEYDFDKYFDTLFHTELDVLSQIPPKIAEEETLVVKKGIEEEGTFAEEGTLVVKKGKEEEGTLVVKKGKEEEGIFAEEEEQQSKKRKCISEPIDIRDYTIVDPQIDIISLIPIEGIIEYFSKVSKNPVILKILGLEPEKESYKIDPSRTFKPYSSIIIPNTQSIVSQEIVGNCWVFAYSRIINKYTQLINTIICSELGIEIPKTLDMTIDNNELYKYLSLKFLNMTYIIGTANPTTGLLIEGCINKPSNDTFVEIKTEIELFHISKRLPRDPIKIKEYSICFMNRLVNLMFHLVSFDSISFSSPAVSTGCNLTAQSCLRNNAVYCLRANDFGRPIMDKYAELYVTQVKDIPYVIRFCKKQMEIFYGTNTFMCKDMLIPLESLERNGYVDLLTKSRVIQQNIYGRLAPSLKGSLIILRKIPVRDDTKPGWPFIIRNSKLDFTSSIEGWNLEISGVRKTYYRAEPPNRILSTPITSQTRSYKNYNINEVIELIKVLLSNGIYIELTCELDMAIFKWRGIRFAGLDHPVHALVFTKYTYNTVSNTRIFNVENSWKEINQITEMTEADLLILLENNLASISFFYPGYEIDIDALIIGAKRIWPVRVSVP